MVKFALFICVFIYECSAFMPTCQKRAPYLITGGCEPPGGCWELNSEQPMFLIAMQFLQSHSWAFIYLLKKETWHNQTDCLTAENIAFSNLFFFFLSEGFIHCFPETHYKWGWPYTHRDCPDSASQVLRLKVYITKSGLEEL